MDDEVHYSQHSYDETEGAPPEWSYARKLYFTLIKCAMARWLTHVPIH